MISRGLFALITGEPSINSLIPGGMWPTTLPKGTNQTALTYQRIGGSSMPTFDTPGLQKVRYQFDVWGFGQGGFEAAEAALGALIKFFNQYSGVLSDGTDLQYAELIWGPSGIDQDTQQPKSMVEFYLYFNFN